MIFVTTIAVVALCASLVVFAYIIFNYNVLSSFNENNPTNSNTEHHNNKKILQFPSFYEIIVGTYGIEPSLYFIVVPSYVFENLKYLNNMSIEILMENLHLEFHCYLGRAVERIHVGLTAILEIRGSCDDYWNDLDLLRIKANQSFRFASVVADEQAIILEDPLYDKKTLVDILADVPQDNIAFCFDRFSRNESSPLLVMNTLAGIVICGDAGQPDEAIRSRLKYSLAILVGQLMRE